MYKFEYTLEEQDYVEFNRYIFYKSPIQRKNMLWLRFGVAAISLMLLPLAARFIEAGATLWTAYAILVLLPLGWIIFFNYFLTSLFRRLVRKQGVTFGQNLAISFDGNQITEKTEYGENRINYESIKKIADQRQGLYIFVDDIRAVILPLRVFESDEQKAQFLEHLRKSSH